MLLDADDTQLHYKKGVPTTGVQGITAMVAGSVDEYLDWAVPSYAKMYNLTKDQHYLDVARVLLHDTKSMVALPGRQYDVKGVGWQQEGWRMGPGAVSASTPQTTSTESRDYPRSNETRGEDYVRPIPLHGHGAHRDLHCRRPARPVRREQTRPADWQVAALL
jgi:hypothetical protein